ncbi:hypothetical protein P7C70_g6660, partial [Phenoliferia sp. Uapishka_3]
MRSTPTFWTNHLVFAALNEGKEDNDALALLYSDPMTQIMADAGAPAPVTSTFVERLFKLVKASTLAYELYQQGKGYGTEAMEWLLEQAFKRHNLHRLGGGTWAFNAPARRLYAKLGFTEEGVLREKWWIEGEWHDEIAL